MDIATIQALGTLNNDFYRVAGESFSQSRQSAWPGWQRVASHLKDMPADLRVLDVACGNLRFERFLQDELPQKRFSFTCVDSALFPNAQADCEVIQDDVLDSLINGEALQIPSSNSFDLAVSFGFMHHVPGIDMREAFVSALIYGVKPGGLVALSFWQFMNDDNLAEKAEKSTLEALRTLEVNLEENDYLLGWNDVPGLYRYCHSFADDEVVSMIRSAADRAELIDTFSADGRNSALNKYVVLRKR